MAIGNQGAENFDISRVISRAFSAIGANAGMFFGITLILSGIPTFLVQIWQLNARTTVGSFESDPLLIYSSAAWVPVLASILVAIITNAVVQASLTRATVLHLSNQTPGFGECLRVGLVMAVPLIVISVLMTIALMIGFILLIIPGIILWLIWSVVVPVYVQERAGIFGSFGRSAELTSGARLKIFLLMVAVVIGMWILSIVTGVFGAATALISPYLTIAISVAITTVSSVVMVSIIASIYVELRDVKEGVAPGELEAIFA